MPILEEATLLSRLKHGDRNSFNRIYEQYWQKLYIHAYKRVNTPELAEDLIQEIFIHLWLKRADLVITKTVEAYLFGVLKNKILMHFRELYAENENNLEYSTQLSEFDNKTERSIEYKDVLNQVEALIEQLPTQSKNVFILSRKEFLSNREIADRLQVSIKTVEYHINYSLNFLRDKCPDYILTIATYSILVY